MYMLTQKLEVLGAAKSNLQKDDTDLDTDDRRTGSPIHDQ